jgi:uncharacterized membrane protein
LGIVTAISLKQRGGDVSSLLYDCLPKQRGHMFFTFIAIGLIGLIVGAALKSTHKEASDEVRKISGKIIKYSLIAWAILFGIMIPGAFVLFSVST